MFKPHPSDLSLFRLHAARVIAGSRICETQAHLHHGHTSVLTHSVAVAYYSFRTARFLGLKVRESELIRGALLHDYFLYDWRRGRVGPLKQGLHGYAHPKAALENAGKLFPLTPVERDIIRKHMFPLTPVPPKCRESLIVCMVDKACCVYEHFVPNAYARSAVIRSICPPLKDHSSPADRPQEPSGTDE